MTVHAPLGRRTVPFSAMVAGAVVTVAGSFLPWVRSGSRSRHSYDVFRVVGNLGFASDGAAATALRWWPFVPFLAVAAVVAVWWGWARAGGAIGVGASCYAGAVGLTVLAAPAGGLVDIGAGPAVTVVGAVLLLAGSVAALVVGVGATHATLRRATSPDPGARP